MKCTVAKLVSHLHLLGDSFQHFIDNLICVDAQSSAI